MTEEEIMEAAGIKVKDTGTCYAAIKDKEVIAHTVSEKDTYNIIKAYKESLRKRGQWPEPPTEADLEINELKMILEDADHCCGELEKKLTRAIKGLKFYAGQPNRLELSSEHRSDHNSEMTYDILLFDNGCEATQALKDIGVTDD